MIDTIGIFVPDTKAPFNRLTKVKYTNDRYIGNLGNFKFFNNGSGIFIIGSIAKFYQGNNAIPLNREAVGEAIRKLELDTNIDLKNAHVYRIDIGSTFLVEKHPANYLSEWGYLPRFDKAVYNDYQSVNYIQKNRCFKGYDKIAEMNNRIIPEPFESENALRLELSILRKVKYYFGEKIYLWDLTKDEIYNRAVFLWKDLYFKIPKGRKAQLNLKGSTAKGLKDILAANGLQALGYDDTYRIINTSAKYEDIDKTTATRMRKLIKELGTDDRLSSPNELALEIDAKVKNISSHIKGCKKLAQTSIC